MDKNILNQVTILCSHKAKSCEDCIFIKSYIVEDDTSEYGFEVKDTCIFKATYSNCPCIETTAAEIQSIEKILIDNKRNNKK